jgi:predicted dehydrogenase
MANRSRNVKRILVVGGGLIGIRHLEAVQAHANCELVGLADPDMTLAMDVPRFSDMENVDVHVDGAIIATPTHLHSAHGIQAAKRGWHLLIEKPVADDLGAARQLETEIKAANIGSLVAHHRRYHASVQQLKQLISNGAIGTVVATNLIWAMRKPDTYFEGNWRKTGGSPVMINLVHDIDFLRFVVGEIATTTALRGKGLRGKDRIESGAIALAFENGATGTISFADTAPTPWGFEAGTGENPNIGTTGQDMVWIMGTKGAISFPSMTLWAGTNWQDAAQVQPLVPAKNAVTPLTAQLDHFIDVMDGAPPLTDVADAIRTLAIAQNIEEQLTA